MERNTRTEKAVKYPRKLQDLLEEILGSRNVYFQPPSNKRMSYPCIVYELDYVQTMFADNRPYSQAKRYSITYIDKMPDMTIPDIIASLPMCNFSRFFTTDDFNHYVYKLYFED